MKKQENKSVNKTFRISQGMNNLVKKLDLDVSSICRIALRKAIKREIEFKEMKKGPFHG